jgi:hypothetical protein
VRPLARFHFLALLLFILGAPGASEAQEPATVSVHRTCMEKGAGEPAGGLAPARRSPTSLLH